MSNNELFKFNSVSPWTLFFQQGDAEVLVQPHAAGAGAVRPALRRLRRPHARPPRPRPQAQLGQGHQAEQARNKTRGESL